MMEFAAWLQATTFFTALRESWYVYPTILSLHMVGIALFGGLVLVSNLRQLRGQPVDVGRKMQHLGLTLMVVCGVLMLGTKAEEYFLNPWFQAKMVLLALLSVHSVVFRPGKLAAVLSLLLWIGLVICGRGIGYINPDLDRVHASGDLKNNGSRAMSATYRSYSDADVARAARSSAVTQPF
jgi:hypothetical protein